MLEYYHGSDKKSIYNIYNNGADISKGSGELGQGFYVGSSLWRAFSWAWMIYRFNLHARTFLQSRSS